ncbi:MAG TPA: DNA primase DnaG [Candidatus Acidoferrum sp.]|nr:DNA primase DnaG [Candidatus Acidoferrum sp.]
MGTDSQYAPTTKYVVLAAFEVEGVVEKPDVIGAIFGQTEGLFGPDLDLRELQKSGRVGRIEIQLESKHDKTTGTIMIPSSLDKVSTAIIAAAIESVDRIGPCIAKVTLEKVEDVREEKRKLILDKAKDILKKWVIEGSPSTDEMVKEVGGAIRSAEITEFGADKLPAGPDVQSSGSIIVVEGRADVLNLLRCGIKNAVAIEGTKIPQTIIALCKNKEVTAFLDGDRGGDLILKELDQVTELDYLTRAPAGKEVEELTPKEIMKALRDRVAHGARAPEARPTVTRTLLPDAVVQKAQELKGTLEASVFDESGKEIAHLPVSELANQLPTIEAPHTLIFDGVITQRILDLADQKKIKYVLGDRLSEIAKKPSDVMVLTMSELGGR